MANGGDGATDGDPRPDDATESAAALPLLTGWKFALFRSVWFLALALAVGGTIAGIHYQRVWQESVARPFTDLGLRSMLPPDLLGPPIGSQARAAGIEAGMRLVEVNGRAVQPGATQNEIAALLVRPEGTRVRIRTQSPGGHIREHVLTRSRAHVAEAYAGAGITYPQRRVVQLIASLAAAAVNIAAAVMLFRRRARDPVAAALSLAFLLLVTAFGTAWDTFHMLDLGEVSTVARTIGYAALFAGIAAFPEGRLETRWRRVLVAAIGLWVLVALSNVAGAVDVPGIWLNLSAIALLAGSIVSLATRYRRLPLGVARQQIRWAFLGFTVGGALGSATIVIETAGGVNPNGAGGIWLNMLLWILSNAALALLALGLLVSLLRYRLYDADAAISRSAGYAALTLLLAGTFGATAKLIEWFFESSFGRDAGALPGAIGAGLAVVLITPMHNRIRRWAERRFQKALLHLRRDLPDCVGDLRETAGMAELLDEVLARILAGTRAVRAEVVIDGSTVAARGDGGADFPVSVPLRVEHQRREIGTLLVGPRPDGSAPGKDEREALAEIADPIARSVRIVRLREEKQQRLESELADLRAALQRLARLEADRGPLPA